MTEDPSVIEDRVNGLTVPNVSYNTISRLIP
jgi:hypothetical protein